MTRKPERGEPNDESADPETALFESGVSSTHIPITEETVVIFERYQGGDEEAGNEFVRRYQDPLLRYVRAKMGESLRQQFEPHDVVHDTIVKALPRLAGIEYRGRGSFLAYLKATAQNLIRNLGRRPAPPSRHVDTDSHSSAIHPEQKAEQRPSQVLFDNELKTILSSAADQLPEREREIVYSRHYFGGSWSEIAEQMGYENEHAAEQFFQRARKHWFELAKPRLRGWISET